MKKFAALVITMFVIQFASAQKLFSVGYQNHADIAACVMKHANQADLKVYKVDYSNQAKGNKGLWFFTEYSNQADKTIFLVNYPNQADLKIFYVEFENQAGWVNEAKKELLD
ncbi:MAG: DUF6150 family protein [Flavobacteriaceae bacterium]|jgi:hypothetical protein|nr:DUF6150 family protein [Flavobacteriaceae bacterium]